MKLFDKLKNALFEEEYVEIEEVEKPAHPKRDPIAKKIDLSSTNSIKESRTSWELDKEKENGKSDLLVSDRDLLKPDDSFKFPMAFEEEDFTPEPPVIPKPVRQAPLYQSKEEKKIDLYQKKKEYQIPEYGTYEKKEEVKMFRPSPIISPIYGVLDRNYTKEEVVPRNVRISGYKGKMDIDAVREKAYGDLTSEIGLAMDAEEKKKEQIHDDYSAILEDDNLLFDMSDDDTPAVNKVTVGDAEEYFQDLGLEYNIDYRDASKEKATGRRVYKSKELEEDVPKKNESLEDNLFDLIDSMYEDKG